MKFALTEKEMKKFKLWDKKHNCKFTRNSGAIGGALTFSFTPTSIGDIHRVECACKEVLDLTDYSDW